MNYEQWQDMVSGPLYGNHGFWSLEPASLVHNRETTFKQKEENLEYARLTGGTNVKYPIRTGL